MAKKKSAVGQLVTTDSSIFPYVPRNVRAPDLFGKQAGTRDQLFHLSHVAQINIDSFR